MNTTKLSKLFALIFVFIPFLIFSQNNSTFLVGNWIGDIEFQGKKLPLVIRIIHFENDSTLAFMDSPDQGAKDIKVSKLTLKNDSVTIRIKSISASITGILNTKDSTISGVFRQNIFNNPIVLKKIEKIPEINRPQEPKPPYPYIEREVTFYNNVDNVELAGTLTLPSEEGIFPAVVLVSGSGPQNRDEELLGHKPFLVIADFLTKKGIAVLRYDDRGVGKSKGNFNIATTYNFANDAEAAFDFLKKSNNIDTNNIGIIGHSEGGMVAPIVASRNNSVKFIVLLAGPGVSGEEILLLQQKLISKAEGADESYINNISKLNKKIYGVLKKEKDNTIAARKIRKIYDKFIENADNEQKILIAGEKEVMIQQITTDWFRNFLIFEPSVYLTKTKCAVLALNGEKDLQVPADINLSAIDKHLKKAGNKNYVIKKYPNLNHLFQNTKTGALSEYGKIEETFSPTVLEDIALWIHSVVK